MNIWVLIIGIVIMLIVDVVVCATLYNRAFWRETLYIQDQNTLLSKRKSIIDSAANQIKQEFEKAAEGSDTEQHYFIVKNGELATSINCTHQEDDMGGAADSKSFGFAEPYRRPLMFSAGQAVKYLADCDSDECYMLPVTDDSAALLYLDGKTK